MKNLKMWALIALIASTIIMSLTPISSQEEVPIDLYINDINDRPDSKPYISETNRTICTW